MNYTCSVFLSKVLVRTARRRDGAESFSFLTVTDTGLPFSDQLDIITSALENVTEREGAPVLVRVFLSDPAGQSDAVRSRIGLDCPLSIIGQPPLSGAGIAVLVWCRRGAQVSRLSDRMHKVESDGTCEFWYTGGVGADGDSFAQTVGLLDGLSAELRREGLTLQDNCARTWLFVKDIDSNYQGVVEGRNKVFDDHNLTTDTHFIASTGIQGFTGNPQSNVMLDAVSVCGPDVNQRYLYGITHLNRTSEYGVRFERGVVVESPKVDRVYISGTASIDNKGRIMYEGDIVRQTERMLENVEVLLSEAGCGFSQVGMMIVYLRNRTDYEAVKRIMDSRFADCPRVIVHAPVCRPGWLVEMECVAIL